ncbi:unnamed protein product, partial [Rotaria magnacalcarata]
MRDFRELRDDQATIFILFVDDATFKVFLAEFDKRAYWL